VPERVVDFLESVEVEHQQRHRQAVALCATNRLGQTIVQQRAVRQVGQRVVISEVGNPLCEAPPLAPHRGLAHFMTDRRQETAKIALANVVVRAGLHRINRRFFARRSGHEQHRQIGIALTDELQRANSAEAAQGKIDDDDVPAVTIHSGDERLGGPHSLPAHLVAHALEGADH
jgi:hypothetical protein